jgi:isocitrate dehydrogenase kinase/phosphatase
VAIDPLDFPMNDALATLGARLIRDAFARYNAEFSRITQRARTRFEQRDWAGKKADAVERIELYDRIVGESSEVLKAELGAALDQRETWAAIKLAYAAQIEHLLDCELNKTFYNTLTRRFFKTAGVDPDIEFVALDIEPIDAITHPVARHAYWRPDRLERMFRRALADYRFSVPFQDIDRCASRIALKCRESLKAWGDDPIRGLELLQTVFYRERRAYLVGRLFGEEHFGPIVIALENLSDGIRADAVITDRDDVAQLFGFTRSYFFADLPTVGDAIVFLRSLMPTRAVSELYISVGRLKQGKTERYRHFYSHLEKHPDELFVHADGDRGLVMAVFTLKSYPLVFKIIRDSFGYPKTVLRHEVIEKYQLVFKHDRAGRLIDAQEFRHLRFPRAQFAPKLLEELLSSTRSSVIEDGEEIVIKHCYVERCIRPLNLYLKEAPAADAQRSALDYGQAIKDLARSNVFAGDLLFKNFGVTKSGRVIFYDYDELCRVTECRFRDLPTPRDDAEESSREPFFYVGDADVFPEQFIEFLHLDPGLRQAFLAQHGDIFDPNWWRALHARLDGGENIEILPYRAELRLG